MTALWMKAQNLRDLVQAIRPRICGLGTNLKTEESMLVCFLSVLILEIRGLPYLSAL